MKHIFTLLVLLSVMLFSNRGNTQETICATVRIEIKQELAFERQGFDARMRISNTLTTLPLGDISIEVLIQDENGSPVPHTSRPNGEGLFFVRTDWMNNITNVSGSGTIAPASDAEIHWLIIPTAGASGGGIQGKRYMVGAKLKYSLGGESHEVNVAPDLITVKPQPELILDYFLPSEVRGDDPITPQTEAIEPYNLGVRIQNLGKGTAGNVTIDSAQPKIVENNQGLLIGFQINGSSIDDAPSEPTLLLNFGALLPDESRTGRWEMETSLAGRFVSFGARFSHADELGGRLTSLIKEVRTHFLIRDVINDLPERDSIRDFLASDGGVLRLYESEGIDSEVRDLSSIAALVSKGDSFELTLPVTEGALYVKIPDPTNGTQQVRRVVRQDGRVLPIDNSWNGTLGTGSNTKHFFNLFDVNGGGRYTVEFGLKEAGPKPPVIHSITDRSTVEGRRLTFMVEASDPNGTHPTITLDQRPRGARFTDQGNGGGVFDWPIAMGQTGRYPVTFRASDGVLSSAKTIVLTVNSAQDTDGDGLSDEWEILHFGNLSQDGSGDYDKDGRSDKEEYGENTDPTYAGDAPGVPLIIAPADSAEVSSRTPTLQVQNGAHGVRVPTYHFEVYADSRFTALVASAGAIPEGKDSTPWTITFALNDNTLYFWRTRATIGEASSEWAQGSFFVNTVNDAPSPPVAITPTDGAVLSVLSPVLTVANSTDLDNDPLTYTFELALDKEGRSIISRSSTLSSHSSGETSWVVPVELQEDTSYYWRTIVNDPDGAMATSPWSHLFINRENNAPTSPLPLFPINADMVQTTDVALVVQVAKDPEGDPISYLFEVDSTSTFDSPGVRRGSTSASSSNEVSFQLRGLEENTRYLWRVKASDGAAESAWSQGEFFVNVRNDPPTTPVIKNPGNGAWIESSTPILQLYSAIDPDGDYVKYHFELYSDASLTTRIGAQTTGSAMWQIPFALSDNSTYYWRAIAEDIHGVLSPAWTPISSFFVNENGRNDPPQIHMTAPSSLISQRGGVIEIRWSDTDPDSNAEVRIYANDLRIAGPIPEDLDGNGDLFLWNIDGLPPGEYKIRGEITDGASTGGALAAGSVVIPKTPSPVQDFDGDGVPDDKDNCPYRSNRLQLDRGSLLTPGDPDGIGDVCQCGDVDGDGAVTKDDAQMIIHATTPKSKVQMVRPELCDLAGGEGCSSADAATINKYLGQKKAWLKNRKGREPMLPQLCKAAVK